MAKARILFRRPDFSIFSMDEDITSFECSRSENTVGAFTCTLPMRREYEQIEADYMLELQRSFDGELWSNDLHAIWFVRSISIDYSEEGAETLTLTGTDQLGLLQRRIVAYFQVQDTENGQNYYSCKDMPAKDMLRQIVRENFTAAVRGVPADDEPGSTKMVGRDHRIMPHFLVEDNDEDVPIVHAEFAWADVGSALNQVVDAVLQKHRRLIYDLVYDDVGRRFIFRCWLDQRGVDRSASVLFSLENGNVLSVRMTKDFTNEATWAHVGGDGQGTLRVVAAATNAAFDRTQFYPIECFVDASDVKNNQDLLERKGKRELNRRRPRWMFSAQAQDTPHCRFGIDFRYGDKVTIAHRDHTSYCRIKSVRLRYSGGVEQLEIPLESDEIL